MSLRIGIFRALQLGDMLCIIPCVRAIRLAYPEAAIHLIGLPWQKDFVKRFPGYFDHFIDFPGWPGLPEQPPDFERIIEFLREIRAYRFDVLLQMQGNGEITNSLCMLWGARMVCGLRKADGFAPTEGMFPVSPDGEHEILRFLKLLPCLGIEPSGTALEFPLTRDEKDAALKMLRAVNLSPGTYVCVHPGARDVRRRWPVENFAFIAEHLAVHGYSIVLTGSGEERSLLSELQARISQPVVNIVEAFGHLDIGDLAGILKHTRLLISNDTGVSHVAAALGTTSVILFSAYSDPERWKPLDGNTHLAIPYEQAKDRESVLRIVLRKLTDEIFETI